MTPTETVAFVGWLGRLFPTFKFDAGTPAAWHGAGLAFVSTADAQAAGNALAVRTSFVALDTVMAEVRRIRDRRHEAEPIPDPGTGDDAVYRERIKASVARIGDGYGIGARRALAAPPVRHGPPPADWNAARGITSDEELARAVRCPWEPCQARPSISCTNAMGRTMPHSHPGRITAGKAHRDNQHPTTSA